MASYPIIRTHCHARVGLVGNPSDGFNGKTISALVHNWAARVTLWASPELVIEGNEQSDPSAFESLADLHLRSMREGYYGGVRLIRAICKRCYEACGAHHVVLPNRNFTIRYSTDIPRGVGLAGSSAIVTAALRALMEFYEAPVETFGSAKIPNLVLSAETQELGITAGPQDRVIQNYGGVVYMDFDQAYWNAHGHGRYVPLDVAMPPLYIAMVDDPTDSGGIHAPVRVRWEQGDQQVRAAMLRFASFAEEGRTALEQGDWDRLAQLMNANFDLRREVYGDQALGPANLRMVEIARKVGVPATFAGSGGAIVGLYNNDAQFRLLADKMHAEGFGIVRARVKTNATA